jgi:hypothetical protein
MSPLVIWPFRSPQWTWVLAFGAHPPFLIAGTTAVMQHPHCHVAECSNMPNQRIATIMVFCLQLDTNFHGTISSTLHIPPQLFKNAYLQAVLSGACFGMFFFTVCGAYALCFWYLAVLVDKEVLTFSDGMVVIFAIVVVSAAPPHVIFVIGCTGHLSLGQLTGITAHVTPRIDFSFVGGSDNSTSSYFPTCVDPTSPDRPRVP